MKLQGDPAYSRTRKRKHTRARFPAKHRATPVKHQSIDTFHEPTIPKVEHFRVALQNSFKRFVKLSVY